MASRMCIAVVFAAFFLAGVAAQDCTLAMTQLTPCLTYITGPDVTPPSACCQGIMTVNAMNPACLCAVIAQLDQSNPAVNATKAYALPSDCNVVVDTASCPAFSAPPLPGFAVPPGIALPPTGLSLPPGLSVPPGLPPISVPPSAFVAPAEPPLPASPPELTAPPALPPTTPPPPAMGPTTGEPVAGGPVSSPDSGSPPAEGPGSAGGMSPAPVPQAAGASAVRASMIFCAALAGVLALLL